ncbi:vomeronasal type-2 receptor 26 [Xenopus tropicalis]|uniref:Vomeronasal type-2 receptor 26 n=1 Tax=Xenopus tropicalis TaxID=8364 RepID=A0A8J0S6T7_XENTR|nr:vomeronasal type-2 receptor 26 [Xenopus tropicalis]|eukprot:XP_012811543.1 PREDICTED: vomeronasal type-2 receptor 26-like [Xenopus tropicalis]
MAASSPLALLLYLTAVCLVTNTSWAWVRTSACNLEITGTYEDYEYVQEGDIMIGGVLTVNSFIVPFKYPWDSYSRMLCVWPLPEYYRQFVDFHFAIEKSNNDPLLLPNLTLGYHISDSCGDPRKAVRSVLQILSGTREPVPNYSCVGKRNIAGFIGDLSSETTVPIAQILTLYGYSQISYGATDTSLSDRVTFPYFFRTLQSDHGHYFSLSKLLKAFGGNWVGIITSDDISGEKELQILTNYLSIDGICVEFTIKISDNMDDISAVGNIRHHLPYKNIIQKSTTNVVILCGKISLGVIGKLIIYTDVLSEKILVVSPTLTSKNHIIDYSLEIFSNILGFVQHSAYSVDSREITHYLESFRPSTYPEDKLLEDIWLLYHLCLSKQQHKNYLYANLYKYELHNCTGQKRITDIRHFDSKLYSPSVALAVDMMSHAIHAMHISLAERPPENRKQMYKYQVNIYLNKLHYKTTGGTTVSFEKNGELVTWYMIYNCILEPNNQISVNYLGTFQPRDPLDDKSMIRSHQIIWISNKSQIPSAQCSASCLPGLRKVPRIRAQPCCYDCAQCSEGDISNATDSENCYKCPDMEWPNEKRDQCILKSEDFLSYSNHEISMLFGSVSLFLSVLTVLIMGIFLKYRDTPIVRANNRSLSFLLLVSIKLSFLSVFLFLGRPVDITCMLRIITFGITFSIAVSSLLAKTIMVCVAFKATKPGSSWRKWLGVKLSNSVVLFCSSIQIIICMTWLAISPPFQELDIHTSPGTIIIQCNEGSAIGFYSVIGYMGLLAAVSFVLAFLARSLPDSFNEAKYITFSMLLFCSVWITMIPAYLSTKGKNTVCVEIFAILTSSAGLLACIFLPKCYIILITPETNKKFYLTGKTCGYVK